MMLLSHLLHGKPLISQPVSPACALLPPAAVGHCLCTLLQQDALLRVHQRGLSRRQPKSCSVKHVD